MKAGILVLVAALVLPASAEAHKLSLDRAQGVVDAVAERVATGYTEDDRYDRINYGTDPCERRSAHRAICDFAWSYRFKQEDYYVCSARLGIRLRSRTSNRLVVKVLRRKCEKVA